MHFGVKLTVFLATSTLILSLFIMNEDIEAEKDLPDQAFRSTELFFEMNNNLISIPAVALDSISGPLNNGNPFPKKTSETTRFATTEFKNAVREFASDRSAPAKITTIRIIFISSGTKGTYEFANEFCQKLLTEQSKTNCVDQLQSELNNLPTRFYLSTRFGLERFRHNHFAGISETMGDLLDTINPILPTAKMACAVDQGWCVAAILVSDELFAVWGPFCVDNVEADCRNNIISQGVEIQKFVKNRLMIE